MVVGEVTKGPRTAAQRLPRHMRRRAMSHDVRRMPHRSEYLCTNVYDTSRSLSFHQALAIVFFLYISLCLSFFLILSSSCLFIQLFRISPLFATSISYRLRVFAASFIASSKHRKKPPCRFARRRPRNLLLVISETASLESTVIGGFL